MLEPGLRDRTITVQSMTEGVGASGRPVQVWADLVTMPAHKRSMTGSETYKASQWAAKAEAVFEVNWRADLDPDTVNVAKVRRVIYAGRVHDVVHIDEVGRREGLRIYTLAGAWLA